MGEKGEKFPLFVCFGFLATPRGAQGLTPSSALRDRLLLAELGRLRSEHMQGKHSTHCPIIPGPKCLLVLSYVCHLLVKIYLVYELIKSPRVTEQNNSQNYF